MCSSSKIIVACAGCSRASAIQETNIWCWDAIRAGRFEGCQLNTLRDITRTWQECDTCRIMRDNNRRRQGD
jgi:hypothetical protein